MLKCTYCNKEIVLVPSAEERAKKCTSGHSASYYRKLFTAHSECQTAAWYNRPNPQSTKGK